MEICTRESRTRSALKTTHRSKMLYEFTWFVEVELLFEWNDCWFVIFRIFSLGQGHWSTFSRRFSFLHIFNTTAFVSESCFNLTSWLYHRLRCPSMIPCQRKVSIARIICHGCAGNVSDFVFPALILRSHWQQAEDSGPPTTEVVLSDVPEAMSWWERF